jgi:hypothetical protein
VCQKEDDRGIGGSERRLKRQKEKLFQNPKKSEILSPQRKEEK